ncbi:unnamed protein product, partial [Sphagnum jensenii]
LSDGDLVSCIPITKQPAVTDSATPIQLEPSMVPSKPQNQNENRKESKQASQRFALEVGSCPAGTIPVRRRSPDQTTAESDQLDSSSASVSIHEHAYASTTIAHPPSFKGTEVILNVWEPLVEPHCFSLAQLWLINTGLAFPYNSSDGLLNTIEAGWQVFPDLYGDNHARLFIYWTGDDYQETGCYNLNQGCEAGSLGFIQVSNKVLIGGSIAPTSIVNSTQYEIKLQVFKDDISGNWWLQFNDEFVGYWPRSLFHSLKDTADAIDWGGEVIVHNGNSPHMHTNMGSGEASYLGYKKAAYQRNLQYVGTDNALHIATGLEAVTEAALCYGIMAKSSKYWGSFVYYGGSGSCCNFSL